tara:strand:+ start:431 stop:1549 length:1119 start_codon:yes stop_codon:yes gene_type:complete
MLKKNIQILDTTLREGEQTSGVSFTVPQKLKIVKMLDAFGVDFIEVGHPAVSADIYESIKEINKLPISAKTVAHCRLKKEDIHHALDLKMSWIGIFFGTSQSYLFDKYKIDEKKCLEMIEEGIKYAKDNGLKVRFTAEDASRTDRGFLLSVAQVAEKAGVDRFSIADTVGILYPEKVSQIVSFFVKNLNIPIHAHFHNDFGLATSNALQAIQSGATCVDVSINGLGERCGISSLAEVTMSLNELLKVKNEWNFKLLNEISQYVKDITSINRNDIMPITGKNAFTHNGGLHVASVLKNPSTYEPIRPNKINRKNTFVIDKFSGKTALNHCLKKLGIKSNDQIVDRALMEIKSNPQITNWTDKQLSSLIEKLNS